MSHIITLILDLLTHWTVPSWFSWRDCTPQRENVELVNRLKWPCFSRCVAISMQFVFPCVWSPGYIQYSKLKRTHAFFCSTHCTCLLTVEFVHVYLSVCIECSKGDICTRMCYMTLVCVVQLPLQFIAWWVRGAGQESSRCLEVCFACSQKDVGFTGQAVQGSHQNKSFRKSRIQGWRC